jgi:protein gp37
MEPLLGPVDIDPRIDWVITGGESGPHARPSHPDWFRRLRDQCAAAGVAFFFKQWGEWIEFAQSGLVSYPKVPMVEVEQTWNPKQCRRITLCRIGKKDAGMLLDGREWTEVPRVA